MPENTKQKNSSVARSPVVAIMGHIDHGKSTLLDYIRKTNIVAREAGGITQHISAYEVKHKNEKGKEETITFLDTPGHEAFSAMRERGAKIADIAILIVSAEDGVKPQTLEAWKAIKDSLTPCIVAINKIDKPNANIEKTKMNLVENEIYIEGYGGDVPFALISAKDGTGISELLSLISLVTEMENWQGNTEVKASGYVLEANVDKRRGIQATLIIKNGTLKLGDVVATGSTICPVKIMENFLGQVVKSASFPSPVRLVGFDALPAVGAPFQAFASKEEALAYTVENTKKQNTSNSSENIDTGLKNIPLIIKADTSGSIEAIEKEIAKIKKEGARFLILQKNAGSISEGDITNIADPLNTLVVGFNVKSEARAIEIAENKGVALNTFNIIYKLTEWLSDELEKRRPRIETEQVTGQAKILKTFSQTKERQVVGGKVLEGKVSQGAKLKILRRDQEIGRGRIVELQANKTKVGSVEAGIEFGTMIESKTEIAPGDIVESIEVVMK